MSTDTSLFAIILPTFNHEATLRYSIQSVLSQTVADFTLHVIGDGATDKTKRLVKAFCRKDPRVKYYDFPKSLRTGEPYRNEILSKISSKYICYISDDDLWFPDHLHQMNKLLSKADFAYTFPLLIRPNGQIDTWYGDFHRPFYLKLLLDSANKKYSFTPLSCVGHTLKAYRALPTGWETTPPGVSTDLYMWQKFIRAKAKVLKSPRPTVLHFASSMRQKMSETARAEEIKTWSRKLKNEADLREQLAIGAMNTIYDTFLDFRASMQSTKTWRLHDAALKLIQVLTTSLE